MWNILHDWTGNEINISRILKKTNQVSTEEPGDKELENFEKMNKLRKFEDQRMWWKLEHVRNYEQDKNGE